MSEAVAEVVETDVLVVGAGPTGLMLASWLAHQGVRAVVIDGKDGPTRESRAVVIQARTLEIYDQLGIAGVALDQAEAVRMLSPGYGRRSFGALPIGELGAGVTPYSRLYVLEQSRTESMLYDRLRELGGEVRWGHRFASMEDVREAVVTTATTAAGPVSIRARYLVGADGSASPVRKAAGIGFSGVTSPQTFYVADAVAVDGLRHDAVNIRFGDGDFLLSFPMVGDRHHRLIGTVPDADAASDTDGDLDEAVVRTRVDEVNGVRWGESTWFSTYRVHHRVATSFRSGRVFLAGDAAHVHSPVGGQGMNTGLQDAHDLALRLADVFRGVASERSLDRYEAERRPVALRLVTTTDAAFGLATSPGRRERCVRRVVFPVVIALALRVLPRLPIAPRFFGYVSQTRIHYWMDDAGRVASQRDPVIGRRLRWTGSNFDALRSVEWQVHSYGGIRPADAIRLREQLCVEVHTFPPARRAALRSRTFYLVRPDGFVTAAAPPETAVDLFRAALPDRWFGRA